MTTQGLPRLIAITDAKRFGVEATIDAAKYLCVRAMPRSVVVQLREAELDRNELWRLAQALGKLCQTSEQGLAINHHLELALSVGTPLFHRKPSSVTADEVRAGLNARFGTSWLTQGWHPADETPPVGVDAVLASPAVAPRKGRAALGLESLRTAVSAIGPTPLFALGGIGAREVADVLSTGVVGVAVQAAWYFEPDALLAALSIARSSSV